MKKIRLMTMVFAMAVLIGCVGVRRDVLETETPPLMGAPVSLTFKTHGGDPLEPLEWLEYGGKVTLPIPEREHYDFIGWYLYEQDVDIVIDDNTRILGDWTLHAHWRATTYEVVFKDHDGMIFSVQTLEHGEDAIVPEEPQREGHTFTGWSAPYTGITEDTTLYAQYDVDTYTVTFDSHGGSEVPTLEGVPYAQTIDLPEPQREGHVFLGWFFEPELRARNFTATDGVVSDMRLHALWQAKEDPLYHRVEFTDHDGSILSAYYVLDGESGYATREPQREGYDFIGWDKPFETITEDTTLTALYEALEYTIVFVTRGGEPLEALSAPYESGISPLPMPKKTGHEFVGWYENEAMTMPFEDETMPLYGATLYAKWAAASYTVIFDTKGGTPLDDETVAYGTALHELPNPQKAGHAFAGWFFDDALVTYPFVYMFEEDVTLMALWLEKHVDFTYEIVHGEATWLSYSGPLTEFRLPETLEGAPLTRIGYGAFEGSPIRHVDIPATVTRIGRYAFASTHALHEVTFAPDSVLERIESDAFSMSALTRIDIPANVERIGGDAFHFTFSLESLTFGKNSRLFEIGGRAFQYTSLPRIVIPLWVQYIGVDAFKGASDLTIYSPLSGPPITWDDLHGGHWNPDNRPVVWNYQGYE